MSMSMSVDVDADVCPSHPIPFRLLARIRCLAFPYVLSCLGRVSYLSVLPVCYTVLDGDVLGL